MRFGPSHLRFEEDLISDSLAVFQHGEYNPETTSSSPVTLQTQLHSSFKMFASSSTGIWADERNAQSISSQKQ